MKDFRNQLITLRIHEHRGGTMFASAKIDKSYRPLGALFYSVVLHILILSGLVVLSIFSKVPAPPSILEQAVIIDVKDLDEILFLPILGAGAAPAPESVSEEIPETSEQRPAPRTPGLSYPGPQPIFSDFPLPTNRIQTILQPALENPSVIQPPVFLPNIVRLTEVPRPAQLQLPSSSLKLSDPGELPKPIQPLTPLNRAEIILPETVALPIQRAGQSALTNGPELAQPLPAPPKLPEAAPRTVELLPDLLALSPTPAPTPQLITIPAGEARGRFAISPLASVDPVIAEPGNGIAEPDSAKEIARETRRVDAPTASTPPVKDNNTTATSSAGKATRSSAGSGAGPDAFPGITILGGIGGNSQSSNKSLEPLQTSYGITILSTGKSGAGLPDVGVFSSEQVHTAYLDMRRTTLDRNPSWTVEYALLQSVDGPPITQATGAGLVLPFPAVKEHPAMPVELVRKYAGRLVIVYALINADGKMEQLSVKASPDPLLNEPVLGALRKWSFRPAQLDGRSFAAKALFGIPVWTP